MSEKELRRIIEESEVIANLTKMHLLRFTLDSETAKEQYGKDVETNFRRGVFEGAYEIAMSLGAFGGSYSTLLGTTPEVHQNTFNNLNFAHLESNAQEIKQEIEKLKSAKPLLLKLIDADAKTQWERTFMITIETSNRAFSYNEQDWNEHETKIKSKEAVLDMAILLYQKILVVYDEEITDRKKSPKVKEIIKNMSSLVKQAEKILPTIGKANQKAQRALANGSRPDLKTCNNFIDASAELSELNQQYSTQQNQLKFYTKESLNDLAFPALNGNDTTAEHEIKREWRKFA